MATKATADQPSMAGWKPPYGGGSVKPTPTKAGNKLNRKLTTVGNRIQKKMSPIKSNFKSQKQRAIVGNVKRNIA